MWVVGERLTYHKLMNYQYSVWGERREEVTRARCVNMVFKIFIGVLRCTRNFLLSRIYFA